MRKFLIHISLIISALSVSACIMEKEDFNSSESVEAGHPVTLYLDFESAPGDDFHISTKGGNNHDINDIYILIFSSADGKPGALKNKLYTSSLKKSDVKISNDQGKTASSTSTRITTPIQTTTGESFIFAFGNISSVYAPSEYNVNSLKEQLDALELGTACYEDLMNITVPLKSAHFTGLQRITDSYLLAGSYQKTGQYTRANTPCVIDTSGKLKGGNIRMYRLDAKIDFKIISDTSSESKGTFVPTAWRIYNLPLKSRLMTTAYDNGSDFDGNSPVYTSESAARQNYWNTGDMKIDVENSEYKFSFYMFENRKSPTAEGTELESWEYKHRETMNLFDGSSTEGNTHSFKYAPEYATYVEFDGYFTGVSDYPFGSNTVDGKQHQITATTQYRIHLGDFGSNTGSTSSTFDNFNTLRNYHYTYTIRIKGVDQIIVEVNKEGEKMSEIETPGANGVISYIPSNSYRVDSHFETRSIRIKKSDLDKWTEDDFKYIAQTCYGSYEGTKGKSSPKHDIYWMEFILTHKRPKGTTSWWSYHESAGQSYSSLPQSGRLEKHPIYMSYSDAKWFSDRSSEVKLMYVNEFLQSLWEWKNAPEDPTDHVHSTIDEKVYTIFIKENYYSNSDIAKFTRQKNTSGNSDKNHWKDFCNQPDRLMYVGLNKIPSGETESSIMENICVIRQRSIQTVYNTDHAYSALTSGWGVETIDETRRTISQFDISGGAVRTSKDKNEASADFSSNSEIYANKNNGYKAQYVFMWNGARIYTTGSATNKPETTWERYVDQTTHDAMSNKSPYTNHNRAFLECLTRNRDVDGDGFIDPGELRWYLPAINQLGDIFIGERGIEPEATLYYGQTDWNINHQYLSSTVITDPDNGKLSQCIALGEEGFAYTTKESTQFRYYNVRCVRNLGMNGDTNYNEGHYDSSNILNSINTLSSKFDEPQKYVQINESARTMDLTWLNDESKRGYVNTELSAEHTERSDENQLYNKFQWGDGLVWGSHSYPYNGQTSYTRFSADEVAYGERNNSSMRTLTRAFLYPNDKQNTVQNANASPRQGWRAPNQKELMLLHFHINGFRAGTTHTCNNKDGGNNHNSYGGDNWFYCRTRFSYGGVKANRSWLDWSNNWVTNAASILDNINGPIQNNGNWFRYDNTNESPNQVAGKQYYDYRYAYCIMHKGTSFGLLYLDWYLEGNENTKYCYLVPVRDVR